MAVVKSEDITVAWGTQPPSIEAQTGRWRSAVFQDMQESSDGRSIYFLYDPVADERSGTTGGHRRSNNCVVVFDLSMRCFTHEIPLYTPGTPKFLFALRPMEVGGHTRAIVVSQVQSGGGAVQLHFTLINLSTNEQCTITAPLDVACDYICTIREDAPELIVLANPGLQVWRIAADVMGPTEPIEYFRVNGAQLNHFYDGFICGGTVFLMSANPDSTLDYSRVHLLNMQTQSLTTSVCHPDPRRGFPCPRLQAAIVTVPGYMAVCGGEVVQRGNYYAGMRVQRLNDYWRLDLRTLQWNECSGQMPVPLIEPRLTTTYGGHCYLWGDWDGHLPGISMGGTHLRLIKVYGLDQEGSVPPMGWNEQYQQQAPPMPPPPPYPGTNYDKKEEYQPHADDVLDKRRKKKKKSCCTLS